MQNIWFRNTLYYNYKKSIIPDWDYQMGGIFGASWKGEAQVHNYTK